MEDKDKERLSALECSLIEQDHRLFNVLDNFFIQRKSWALDDPKRKAATKALFWRIFFSPMTVATAGGFVAIFTLIILYQQNSILVDQNSLISEQNVFFQEQIKKQNEQMDVQKSQWVAQRRAQLLDILYSDTLNDSKGSNVRAKSEAVLAFINLERAKDKDKLVDLSSINLKGANLKGANLSRLDLSQANLEGTILQNVNFEGSILDSASFVGSDVWSAVFTKASLKYAMFSEVKNVGLTSKWQGANILGIQGLNKNDLAWIKEHFAIKETSRPMPPSHFRVK